MPAYLVIFSSESLDNFCFIIILSKSCMLPSKGICYIALFFFGVGQVWGGKEGTRVDLFPYFATLFKVQLMVPA